MGAPTDIMQQAGGANDAMEILFRIREEGGDEFIKAIAKTRNARVLFFDKPTGRQQWIGRTHVVRHDFIQHPFANSVTGNRDVGGFEFL